MAIKKDGRIELLGAWVWKQPLQASGDHQTEGRSLLRVGKGILQSFLLVFKIWCIRP